MNESGRKWMPIWKENTKKQKQIQELRVEAADLRGDYTLSRSISKEKTK